jgi:CBS domain-containing protein
MNPTTPPSTTATTRMLTTSVADAMHKQILTCSHRSTITEVAQLMTIHQAQCVAVVDSAECAPGHRVIRGIVSAGDLLRWAAGPYTHLSVSELTHDPVVTVAPTRSIQDAAERMAGHDIDHLLVIDPDHQTPVGILSALDVARVLAHGNS